MECTKCKKRLDISYYSLKNIKNNIYYLHCDICREKINNQKNKKNIEIDNYDKTKNNKFILCKCGKEYIAFRDYHIVRHENTKYHIKNILNK
tara:strand:+ start:113 stop:388 length:276 start_codon:yes stop_codon:yes gene_type:complete